MSVYTLNPLRDRRWAEFVERHASSSVFHTSAWIEAIRGTYGYVPVVYTTSAPSEPLANGILFFQIKSWLTGRRMVSLPFSDHCEPLLDDTNAAAAILEELNQAVAAKKWDYVELRPMGEFTMPMGAAKAATAHLHLLDLRPTCEELFKCFHKDCVQRKVRRAERENLSHESGNSERLLNAFYGLMVQTRRRHELPPQPIAWFRNLIACMGDRLQIRVAFKNGKEVASILTLLHKQTLVYKYGCSDAESQNLGGTPFLFWKTIQEAKSAGFTCIDFGRSDTDNPGLIAFKERFGAMGSELTYFRWSQRQVADVAKGRSSGIVKRLFSVMPDSLLQATGRILYRHVG